MAGGLEIEKGERRPPPLTFLLLLCTIRNGRKPPRRRGPVSAPCSNEICACDGIGRHARFRFSCSDACGFESLQAHHKKGHDVSRVLFCGLRGPRPAPPFGISMLGAAKPPLRQGFRLRRKRLTAQSAAPPAVGPPKRPHDRTGPGHLPGALVRYLITCRAPPDGSGARTGPWRPLRSRRRAPWRGRGRTGSGWSSGPRSSGTPDSRRRGPWSPG